MPKTTKSPLKRLIFQFAWKYRKKLFLGIIAGLLVGGSLYSMLGFSQSILEVIEKKPKVPTQNQPITPTKTKKLTAQEKQAKLIDEHIQQNLKKVEPIAQKLGIKLLDEHGAMTLGMLWILMACLLFTFFIKSLGTYYNRYYMRWVGSRSIVDLRNALFHNLQHQSLSYYSKKDIGDLISRCTNDTAAIERSLSRTVGDICRIPLEIIVPLIFIVQAANKANVLGLLFMVVTIVPLCLVPVIIISRKLRKVVHKALTRVSILVSRMQENFSGIRVVKAYHMEDNEYQQFSNDNDNYFRTVIKAVRIEILMAPLLEFLAVFLACIFLVLCFQKGVSFSAILTMTFAASMAYRPLKQIAKINVNIQKASAAATRLFEILDVDTSLPEIKNPIIIKQFEKEIKFENVSFKYEPQATNIINNLNLTIRKGEVVAFVGETGSGKTTIANLLARFYDPTNGKITMDGNNLAHLEIASLRKLIGLVTQDTILFNDTIANNIRYGSPNATMDEIIAAAKQACAHQFITEEEEGYQRIVGEKGFRLSGGQKQRISIARAILKNPPILILDEATSALDTVTEQQVQKAINHLMENRTVFAIAHRLSTIKHADQIYLLDKGNILEQGTHKQLYNQGKHYRKLCDMQFSEN